MHLQVHEAMLAARQGCQPFERTDVGTSLDFAPPKLGSGARFRKLSSTLAARGAKDPDALAAYIGRKRYGNAGMGKLSAGKSLANTDLGIYLADGPEPYRREPDENVQCPSCGKYNDTDARYCDQCGAKLPASAYAGDDAQASPAAPGAPARPAAAAMANGARDALELATGTVRRPIKGPMDVLPVRQPDGTALLRHRNGGATIATLRKTGDGKWVATVNGRDLPARDHQRTALMEAVGTWNGAITSAAKRQEAPLQPAPVQTELMAEVGIPAMRSAAFATPTAGASDGPRMTTSAASDDTDSGGSDANGLSPKAQAIYKKLIAKGFPTARALAFAKNSEKFGKAAA